jgi:hypothetical protein
VRGDWAEFEDVGYQASLWDEDYDPHVEVNRIARGEDYEKTCGILHESFTQSDDADFKRMESLYENGLKIWQPCPVLYSWLAETVNGAQNSATAWQAVSSSLPRRGGRCDQSSFSQTRRPHIQRRAAADDHPHGGGATP